MIYNIIEWNETKEVLAEGSLFLEKGAEKVDNGETGERGVNRDFKQATDSK